MKNKTKSVKKEENRSDKQFAWLVVFFVAIILIALVGPTIYHRVFNTFEYGGVKFEKSTQDKLTFYHGVFPVIYLGNFTSLHNVYFRTDPRKNNVTVNTELSLAQNVFISLEPGVEECRGLALAQPQLASFISAMPFVKNLTSGTNDLEIAKKIGTNYISCKNASNEKTVIIIRKSSVPSIDLNRTGCYVLNVGECQYLETVEKYIMAAMAQINNASIS